jgi:hypothetical protein
MLAANLRPKDIRREQYDTNSISTNTGTKPNGVPDGTKREKNSEP